MKNKMSIILWILVFVAWMSLGAFCVYFSEFEVFKLTSFIALIGISYLVVYFVGVPWVRTPRRFVKKKIFWSIKAVLVCFIFCLLHFLNQNFHLGLDLTHQKLYKIRQTSQELLAQMAEKEKITLTFLGSKDQWQQNEELLRNYQNVSNQIILNWINPDKEPEKMKQYSGRLLPSLLIETGTKRQWLELIDEWSIGLALKNLQNSKNSQLCFSNDHQELDLNSEANDGLKSLKDFFHAEGYRVTNMKIKDYQVDSACSLFFILGPKDDFLSSELTQLNMMMEKIPVILAIDPWQESQTLKNLRQWLQAFGVNSTGTPLIDQTALQYGEEAINILWDATTLEHPAPDFSQLQLIKGRTLWQMTTGFDIEQKQAAVTSLIQTSVFPKSWQENSWSELNSGKVTFNEKQDLKGPRAMALAVKSSAINSLVILGTSRLWMNGFRAYPANFELGLTLVKSVLKEETKAGASIALREEKLWLHLGQANLIFYMSILVMPLLLLFIALMVFRQNAMRKE